MKPKNLKRPAKKAGATPAVSCRLAYEELKKKNDMFAMTRALGFREPYDGTLAISSVRNLINWTDVTTVVRWLFDNGYDVVRPNGN